MRFISKGWAILVDTNFMSDSKIKELISRRRRQILVHSVIYYKLNENLIDDATWSRIVTVSSVNLWNPQNVTRLKVARSSKTHWKEKELKSSNRKGETSDTRRLRFYFYERTYNYGRFKQLHAINRSNG